MTDNTESAGTAWDVTTLCLLETKRSVLKGIAFMTLTRRFIVPLFAAGAAAVSIAVAPAALAESSTTQQACTFTTQSDTECQSPGNVQLNDSPGFIQYGPQYPYWEGDFYGGYSHRGMGGGRR